MRRPRKHSSSKWFSRRWAEWKHSWTHGLKDQRRKLKKAWKLKKSSFKRWQSSRPIEKKIQEQERKRNARKFNRKVKKAPKKLKQRILDFVVFLAQTPSRSLKSVRKSYKRLRKLTLRELAFELWNLYLGLLAYLIHLPKRLHKRWKKQPAWLRVISGTAAVSLIAFLAASPWLFVEAKQWRAEQLQKQANELIEREQLNLAYELSRSAALLAPEDEIYIEQAIKLADELRHPHAVWWAERMAKRRNYDEESLAKIIEQSLEFNQLGTGARYVSVMRARYPESRNAFDAELELLLKQNLLEQALIKSAQHLNAGHESPMVYRVYVELALRCTNEEVKAEAQKVLLERIEKNDAIALELLKLAQRLSPDEMERIQMDPLKLRERIINHPEATKLDRIEASGYAYFIGHLPEDQAFQAITQEYDLEKELELAEALEFLSRFGNYYGRDEIISEVRIYSDPQFALSYMEWLIFSSQADLDEAMGLLDDENERPLPLSKTKRLFLKAMIACLRGNEQAFSLHMLQSLDNSTPNEWDYMHPILLKHTSAHQQHAFYRELFGRPESPSLAAERYLMLTYQLGMEEELQVLLRQIQPERFQRRPETLSFLLYLMAANDRNLASTRTRLENLVAEYPKAVLFYRNLAFVYAKLGEFGLAQSVSREIPPPPDSANAYIRLAHAYIHQDPSYLPNLDELPTKSEKAIWQALMTGKTSL